MTPRFAGSASRAAGYGLVEVLVAVLILSFGLLGMAGLQTASLRNTHSASQRLGATSLAYDIIERMRANRTQAMAGSYNVAVGAGAAGAGLAAADVAAWKFELNTRLPNGDGSVAVANRVVTVTVQWTEDWDKHNPDAQKRARLLVRSQL